MRIRWKFLGVLLFISLVPMLLMRWTDQRSMRELGDELAIKTMGVLIRRSSVELLLNWPFGFRQANWKKGLPQGPPKAKLVILLMWVNQVMAGLNFGRLPNI
jgi:hypothetical protein